ncbi:MAG TPA: GTP-binding protein [Candidatus Avoscillospira avicola]|uniref:GTP-binding protein n=1 Tax=Candidatus Avoscillospira avicola TaxID=2840706 RepID=A0A9D1IY56_9FIRM|nr:GTP-binding protein [Candidatus Avoscillospira avicola]
MTKIDIYSGFLGAGKTTLIKKMIKEAYAGQKVVLIENEFGEIGIDGGFLQEAGIEITEMNSGCICCSLVGDFGKALEQVIRDYAPDRILIEPSGVGKLSDVEAAVEKVVSDTVTLGNLVTVADASKCKMYMKNFGEFYNNQVESAGTIVLSRTGSIAPEKLSAAVALLREKNPNAVIVTTPWDQLTGQQILEAMEQGNTLLRELEARHYGEGHDEEEEADHHCCHHHDHDEEGEEHHHCHHHDHDEEDEEHHCCHHHDHDEEDAEHHHCHHHDHDHEDGCCHHDHHHHHGHDADEVFTSWGVETPKTFTEAAVRAALEALDSGAYGMILRAKGIIPVENGQWLHFDFVPGEIDLRHGPAAVTGRLCVIGSKLDEQGVAHLFGV